MQFLRIPAFTLIAIRHSRSPAHANFPNEFICRFLHFNEFPSLSDVVCAVQRPVDIKNRPRIPVPDEDPYSEANSASSSGSSGGGGSAGEGPGKERVAAAREQLLIQTAQFGTKRSEKPPKLPPRDSTYHHDLPQVRLIMTL